MLQLMKKHIQNILSLTKITARRILLAFFLNSCLKDLLLYYFVVLYLIHKKLVLSMWATIYNKKSTIHFTFKQYYYVF